MTRSGPSIEPITFPTPPRLHNSCKLVLQLKKNFLPFTNNLSLISEWGSSPSIFTLNIKGYFNSVYKFKLVLLILHGVINFQNVLQTRANKDYLCCRLCFSITSSSKILFGPSPAIIKWTQNIETLSYAFSDSSVIGGLKYICALVVEWCMTLKLTNHRLCFSITSSSKILLGPSPAIIKWTQNNETILCIFRMICDW